MILSGYYNSLKGDRKYNAETMSNYFSGLFTRGVLQNYLDKFVVKSSGGLTIEIPTGKAFFSDGKWILNTAPIKLTLDPSDVLLSRIDRVVLRNDKNESVRSATVVLKKGTPASNPVAPELINNDYVEEMSLATISIGKLVENLTQANITNTIPDNEVCGYVTGLIDQVDTSDLYSQYEQAYKEFYEKSNLEFDEWFQSLKENLSTSTLLRQFSNVVYTTEQDQTVLNIGIPQFNQDIDILDVYVNNLRLAPEVDYTLTNTQITLTLPLDINQQVEFVVFKSIDGDKAITVIEQVEELQTKVSELETFVDTLKTGVYIATGVDDNKKLSDIIQTFINGGNDYKQLEIKVYGTLSCTTPISGTGIVNDPVIWFKVGLDNSTNRRVRLDFAQCERISIDNADKSNSVMFAGNDIYMKNCQASMYGATSSSIFNGERIVCNDCEFWLNQNAGINTDIIGCSCCGTFTNCRVSVTAQNGKAYGFKANGNILKLINCEVYAYNQSNSANESVAVVVEATKTENVLIMQGCNIPIKARSGFKQSATVKVNSGYYTLVGNTMGINPQLYSTEASKGANVGTMIVNK